MPSWRGTTDSVTCRAGPVVRIVLTVTRCFHAAATPGSSRSELIPGWRNSRSRQNRPARVRDRLRSVAWSTAGWRSRK